MNLTDGSEGHGPVKACITIPCPPFLGSAGGKLLSQRPEEPLSEFMVRWTREQPETDDQ